jgi:hypothetical protein
MTEQDLNTLAKVREALRLMQFKYAAMAADGGPNHYERHDIAQRLAVTLARIPEQAEPTATGGGDALRRLGWSMILGVPTYERVPGSDEWATVTNTVPIETWHAAVDEAKGQRVPDLLPTSPSRGGGEPDVLVDLSTYSKWCAATGQRPTDEARTAWEAGRNIALKSQPPTDELRERVEAVIYDIEGTFEAALATPSPAMRALLDRLRAALAATQPEASDAEVGS